MTKQITHGELKNGDLNWRQGYLFRVRNLRRISAVGRPDLTEDVIRFEGGIVGGGVNGHGGDLIGTAYDGGVYGGYASVPTTIEVAAEDQTNGK